MADLTTRADDLFKQAAEVPTDDRRAYLTLACGGDAELRREVERLLAAYNWLADPDGTDDSLCDNPRFESPAIEGEVGRMGKYRIQQELGRGGMGAVYLAFDERLERPVALKVMLPRVAASAAAKDRFLREARAAARISCDHVVNVFEADVTDGVPFIAMQYLRGCPLHRHLAASGPVPVPEAVRMGREVALGLAAAHALGVVHRDIKPGNIWLEAPGARVKILDFGLAKPVEWDAADPITPSGTVLGTPAYMAPEQGRGEPLDHRADLFSLGCVLYHLLTGQQPFGRSTLMGTLTAIATEEPTPVAQLCPQVPPALAALVHRLIAKKPADRPASAEEVAVELDRIAQSAGDRPQPAVSGRKWWRRPAVLVGAGVVGLLLAVAGFIVIKITNKDGSVTELKVPDDAKVEVDGKEVKADPKGDMDADRVAAEVLTKHPVILKLRLPTERVVEVLPGQPLPAGPFAVVEIAYQDGKPLPANYASSVFVPAVSKLKSLAVIQDWWRILQLSKADLTKLTDAPVGAGLTEVDALTVRLTPDTLTLLRKFPKLTGFGMDAFEVDDDLLLRVKKEFPPLTYLLAHHLGNSPRLTEKGLAVITAFPLRTLSLTDFATVDRSLCKAIAAMPDLKMLFFYDVGIDDDDAAELAKCVKLASITLTKSRITDVGLARLATLTNLHYMDVVGTKVTEAGVKKLDAALPKCRIVWDGGTFVPASPGDRSAVEWLIGKGAEFGCSGSSGYLDFKSGSTPPLPDGAVRLNCFKLSKKEFTSDADLERFRGLKSLETVVLSGTRVTDAGVEHVGTLPMLGKLYLSYTPVTSAGLAHLRGAKGLSILHVEGTKVDDTGLEHLTGVASLTELLLVKTKVTEGGVKKLAAALPKCKITSDFGTFGPK